MNLIDLGLSPFFEDQLKQLNQPELSAARVVREHKQRYIVRGKDGDLSARVSGRLRHEARGLADYPCVGDWVAIDARPQEGGATIRALLERRTKFSRKAVLAGGPKYGDGRTEEQVVAANIDTAFLVVGLDGDYNLRRIERYLAIAWDSGALPVIVLNKADLREDVEAVIAEVEGVAVGTSVCLVSAIEGNGIELLRRYLRRSETAVFLGSSGVGKSSIINCLLGSDTIKTSAVREHDSRGRHTTTHRELILLPEGGMVIDTPGLRELQMWNDDDGLSRTFEDIERLSLACRFRNCRHNTEPGCAIQQALADGVLSEKRWGNYLHMQKELKSLKHRQDKRAVQQEREEWAKSIARFSRARKKAQRKGLIP